MTEEENKEYEAAKLRAIAKANGGPVWDTVELGRDFEVESFLAPFVLVRRKSDDRRGTLTWVPAYPRFYYNFVEGDQ